MRYSGWFAQVLLPGAIYYIKTECVCDPPKGSIKKDRSLRVNVTSPWIRVIERIFEY